MDLGLFHTRDLPPVVGALLLAAATLLALVLLRVLVRRAAVRAAVGVSDTSLRAIPLRLITRTRLPVALAIALFVGSLALELSFQARAAARGGVVLALLLQAALWGSDLIAFWTDRYQARATEQGAPGAAATAFALRFMASLVLWLVVVLLAMENVGLEITALVAGLGIGGIAIALAAQSVLGDFFASLAIVLDRPFAVGDFIAVDELRGTVERVGVKTTRVRSIDGEQLIFSNSDLVRSRVRNFGRLRERRNEARFRLAAGTSADAIEAATEIVRKAVVAQPGTGLDRAHFVGLSEGIPEIELVYFVQSPAFQVHMDSQQAIHLRVLRDFEAAGIAFEGAPSSEPAAKAAPASAASASSGD